MVKWVSTSATVLVAQVLVVREQSVLMDEMMKKIGSESADCGKKKLESLVVKEKLRSMVRRRKRKTAKTRITKMKR